MAEEFLEEIYQYAAAVTEMKEAVEWCRRGIIEEAVMNIDAALPHIDALAVEWSHTNHEEGVSLKNSLIKLTQHGKGYIWAGDLLEGEIIPACERYLSGLNRICVDDEEGYCLESSESGFLTIRETGENILYHSRRDPMWEAREQAKWLYDPRKKSYSLLGGGLGYLAYQLYKISDGSVKINLFEYEEKMVQYARLYGVLDWIPEDILSVTVGRDVMPFLESVEDEDVGFYLFALEMNRMDPAVRSLMDELLVNSYTTRRQQDIIKRNFYRNTELVIPFVTEFNADCLKKKFIVVAGGPSLDDCLEFLREQKGNMTIISVGTVFRKLVNLGIQPDMVMMLDPLKGMMKQLKGVENQQVPLFLSPIAYWGLARIYKGPKYLAPTPSVWKEGKEYVQSFGAGIWGCDGTVTTMSVNAAIYFGAKEIYLVGADFSYPGGVTHAEGTDERKSVQTEGMITTESVNGGEVYTNKAFTYSRHAVEKIIGEKPQVKFYNMSRTGAKIKGARNNILDD